MKKQNVGHFPPGGPAIQTESLEAVKLEAFKATRGAAEATEARAATARKEKKNFIFVWRFGGLATRGLRRLFV